MWDSITVLQHPTALATKRHHNLGSTIKTDPYGDGKYFKCEVVPLANLAELYELLKVLATDSRAFCIRGEPVPGRDLERIRRTKKPKDGEPAGFREVPRRWMMLDVDSLDKNFKADWGTVEGCQAAADKLLGQLPMELRTAGYIWQCSASAGVKSGLRMHLFFALDRPLGELELGRWIESVNDAAGQKVLDPAVVHTVQPLYVADPLFENMLDPVAQRMGFVPGVPAALPRLTARADAWKQKLQPLYFESNDKIHDHIRDAAASFFCAHGPEADATTLRLGMKNALVRALEIQGRNDYGDEQIENEIESGRSFARDRVAAGENLLTDNSGQPKGCIANLLAVMQSHDDWRRLIAWNVRAGHIEILRPTPWGSPPGEWRDSVDSVQAAQWFAREKRMAVDDGTVLRAAIAYARETEIDPVADWLNSLEWDSQKHIDEWMIGWCGADDTNYVRRVSRMFLIGLVARALMPGCKHDCMLAMQGETGAGKSSALEVIGGKYHAAVLEEKDILQKIHGPWIVELPELGPFRSMNYNKIKGFLSTRMDRFRAPYMRTPEDRPRRCAIAATVNPEGLGWQEDATSGRRYWPVEVGEINLEALRAAREQLFAEAVVAFRSGEHWWVDDPRDPDFLAAQETIYAVDTWEAAFERMLKSGGNGFGPNGRKCNLEPNPSEFELVDLLAVVFGDFKGERRDQARAARALVRLGYVSAGRKWVRIDTDHGSRVDT
jgi:predicted P-loop ATPase